LIQSAKKPTFLILEGRDRIGGRIYTQTESVRELSTNRPVSFPRDLGAAWVHGTGRLDDDWVENQNPMIPLLQETTPKGTSVAEYHLSPIFEGNAWTRPHAMLHKANRIALFRNGILIPNNSREVNEAIQTHYRIEREVSKYCDHLFEIGEGMQTVTTSMEEVRAKVFAASFSIRDYDSVVRELVPFYAFLSADNWKGISSSDTQLIHLAPDIHRETDEIYSCEGDYEGPHCKLKHGMERVIEPLYQRVANQVFLNETVVKVTRRGKQDLRIETNSGMVIETRCCISTVPVGCLQQGSAGIFHPQLGEEIIEAIDAMSPGFYKKVFLTFDEIFWSAKEPIIGLLRSEKAAEDLGPYLLLYNFWAKDSIPCLEAVFCGNGGKWACGRTDEEIRNAVLQFIEDSLSVKDLDARCIACHVTRWEEDPFTRGTFSSFCLGSLERHIDVLQRPHWDGDLIIAGEFTESVHQGSVQAALLSGLRASKQALDTISEWSDKGGPALVSLCGAGAGDMLVV
jgi:hypothetical protein